MTEKRLFRVFNKETGKTMCWFNDSEDLFHMTEWYSDSEINYGVEEYKLVDEW